MFDPIALSQSQSSVLEKPNADEITDQELQKWRAPGVVVFVGSYVSTFAPSNLPMGTQFGEYVWKLVFGPTDTKGRAWPPWLRADFLRLPFEVLTHCYPEHEGIKRAMQKTLGTSDFNPVHTLLANEMRAGRVHAIITTNYDLCLDAALRGASGLVTVWDERSSHKIGPDSTTPVYWKIHGTATDLDSLIIDLHGEARPPDWKESLLARLINQRSLVVLGYGGRDYEICPALAYHTHPQHVVWIDNSRNVTPNARRVLIEHGGTLVVDDLICFLRRFFGFSAPTLPRERRAIELPINPALIPEWRVRLLDWMACGPLVLSELETIPEPATREALTVSAFGHLGRYYDETKALEKRAADPLLSTSQRLHLELSAASSELKYGAHLRGWWHLRKVEKHVRTAKISDLYTPIAECKIMMLMRFGQIARCFRLRFLTKPIKRLALSQYLGTRDFLEKEGEWGSLQALRMNAQRLGLIDGPEMALPPLEGYASLGAIGMLSIAVRDFIRTRGPWRLDGREKEACLWSIRNAKRYGWFHEEWKFRWILLVRSGGAFRSRHVVGWWKAFRRTQYTLTGRFFQVANATIPHVEFQVLQAHPHCSGKFGHLGASK